MEEKNKRLLNIANKGAKERIEIKEPKEAKTAKTKEDDTALKDALEAEKRKNAAIRALAIENANEQIRINQSILESENSSFPERLEALKKIADQKNVIAAVEYVASIEAETKIEKGKRLVIDKSNEEKILSQTQYKNN